MAPAHAHGSHGGGGEFEAGEFDFTPIITIEGHGGFDNNLEIPEKHYAIDGCLVASLNGALAMAVLSRLKLPLGTCFGLG